MSSDGTICRRSTTSDPCLTLSRSSRKLQSAPVCRLVFSAGILTRTIAPKRWRPVVPLAIPRATSKGDVYAGYDIPAGTAVYGNF